MKYRPVHKKQMEKIYMSFYPFSDQKNQELH